MQLGKKRKIKRHTWRAWRFEISCCRLSLTTCFFLSIRHTVATRWQHDGNTIAVALRTLIWSDGRGGWGVGGARGEGCLLPGSPSAPPRDRYTIATGWEHEQHGGKTSLVPSWPSAPPPLGRAGWICAARPRSRRSCAPPPVEKKNSLSLLEFVTRSVVTSVLPATTCRFSLACLRSWLGVSRSLALI
jgi:hypothetical protein